MFAAISCINSILSYFNKVETKQYLVEDLDTAKGEEN